MKSNVKEPTIENFLAFEREYKCHQIEVEGMPIWSLYRYEVHNAIKKHTVGRVEAEQTAFEQKELFKMALNALRPFNYRNLDVVFVDVGRRNKNATTGVYENIYFDELAKRYNSVILEHPINHTHLQPNGMDNVFFTDRVAFETNIAIKLANKLNTRKHKRYTKQVEETFAPIFQALQEWFGVDLKDELTEGFVERMYYFEITKKYCSKILDKANPKLIMELCYYSMECFAMSALGKERGIPTAEYSHGFAFPTHTPMQYNPEERISVLPDAELIYSRTQEDVVHLPDNIPLITVGYPFFERERKRYKELYPREEKTICFLSTQTEGIEISKFAAAVAEAMADEYRIIYKLHPKEITFYKEKYPWLLDKKIDIIDNLENHVYRYLAESSICVSTCSATVWEGIGFGCKMVLLDIGATAKNMKFLTDTQRVPLVKDNNELINLLKSGDIVQVDSDSIFEPNAMDNICRYIDSIIK